LFRSSVISLLLFVALISTARADSLADALDAHKRGDEKRAVELLVPLAEGGDVTAMNTLSHIYWWGEGVRSDHAEALKWTRRSAARGSSVGQNDLAIHFASGDGVAKDLAIAAALFKLSADQGEAYALGSLSSMYLMGRGVPLDREKGIELLRAAAAQGYYKAQRVLGVFAWQGSNGISKDVGEAIKLLELAAEQRDVEAQMMLSFLYVDDREGTTDLSRAAMWLAIAAKVGCAHAAGMGSALSGHMPAAEYQSAIERALEWDRGHPVDPHRHGELPDICFIGPREGV
jgi:TPR repeat protein